jgi:hypothetical protein
VIKKMFLFSHRNVALDLSLRVTLSISIVFIPTIIMSLSGFHESPHEIKAPTFDSNAERIFAVVIAPVFETAIQVMLLFFTLAASKNAAASIICTALIMAGLHYGNGMTNVLHAFPGFVILGATYVIYSARGLWAGWLATIGVHAAHNAIMILVVVGARQLLSSN